MIVSRSHWVQQVKRSVVKIHAVERDFNVEEPYKLGEEQCVCGSGFFVDQEVLFGKTLFPNCRTLLTNSHVVEGAPTKTCRINFPDCGQSNLSCRVAFICPMFEIDVAVLVLDPTTQDNWFEKMPAPQFVAQIPNLTFEMEKMCGMAEEVVAVGYPLDSDDCVATVGCIACRDDHMFQLAMSINDGNSGGCVCFDGRVMGIATSTQADAEGIAFCIPIVQVVRLFTHWLGDTAPGHLVMPPKMGCELQVSTRAMFAYHRLPAKTRGSHVLHVQPEGTLASAGCKPNDILVAIHTTNKGQHYDFDVDNHGLINVPWSLGKIDIDNMDFLLFCDRHATAVTYLSKRPGRKSFVLRKRVPVVMSNARKTIDTVVPYWEHIPHLLFGGMVFMNLSTNHATALTSGMQRHKTDVGFILHMKQNKCDKPALCISYVFPQSIVDDTSTVDKLSLITHIDGKPVTCVAEARRVFTDICKSSAPFVTLRSDNYEEIILEMDKLRAQETTYARTVPFYPQKTLLNQGPRPPTTKRKRIKNEKFKVYKRTRSQVKA